MDLSSTESVLQAEDGIQKKTTSNPKSQTLNSKFAALGALLSEASVRPGAGERFAQELEALMGGV